MSRFLGFRRKNGTVGVRNRVIVVNTTAECAALVRRIAARAPGVVPVVHQHGYGQFEEDRAQTMRTLIGIGAHPNVAATLFIGIGGPDETAHELAEGVRARGGEAGALLASEGGTVGALVDRAAAWLQEAQRRAEAAERTWADASELIVGLECGGSDAWSGVTANPAVGVAADLVVAHGGTAMLSETTEAIGAEHILAAQAVSPDVARDFLQIVAEYEARMKASGADIRSANPSPGNIRGGLTTLDEKSLGCIKKGGSTPLMEVLAYAEAPTRKGFVFMDTPGYDTDSVTGMVAGGAQVVLFTTGRGSPTGSPIAPVIKVSTNSRLTRHMPDHIDVDAGAILEGRATLEEVGREIFAAVLRVAGGDLVAAERHGHNEFSIWRLAETI